MAPRANGRLRLKAMVAPSLSYFSFSHVHHLIECGDGVTCITLMG
jgi:hypothetical protein